MSKKVNSNLYMNSAKLHTLVIEDAHSGHRLGGAKLGPSADIVARFRVDAKELRKLITEYQYDEVS